MFKELAPVCLYVLVGIISLTMAYKNLFSNRFIPFHEKAAGKPWDQVDNGLQAVVIALMRVSGLGFLVVTLLLTIFPIANYYLHNTFIKYAVPAERNGDGFNKKIEPSPIGYCFGAILAEWLRKGLFGK